MELFNSCTEITAVLVLCPEKRKRSSLPLQQHWGARRPLGTQHLCSPYPDFPFPFSSQGRLNLAAGMWRPRVQDMSLQLQKCECQSWKLRPQTTKSNLESLLLWRPGVLSKMQKKIWVSCFMIGKKITSDVTKGNVSRSGFKLWEPFLTESFDNTKTVFT